MPYLPTSQAFLEQSSLLLKAYPDTTRITTKYTYPPTTTSSTLKSKRTPNPKSKSKPTSSTSTPATETPPPLTTAAPATLTLKTFHPQSGICLKYRTDKAAEVGRLIVGLGRLASGDGGFEDAGVAGAAATGGGDVEIGDAPAAVVESAATPAAGGGGGGGKSKKKSGKGKR